MPIADSEIDAPLLLERYRPLALLARGGMSTVFRGRDEVLGRDVAIKLFRTGTALDVDRYLGEMQVLAGLSHHGVVSIIDAGIDGSTPSDPRPFLVMELVRGKTIAATLAERELSVHRSGEIGYEVAETLEYIHSNGVIHRDITPSNIMLVDYGTRSSRARARLTDFGIAIDASAPPAPSKTTATGTAAYLSPEQVARQPLTTASDIYSLGLVLLECFTGERAFPGAPVESAMSRITADPEIPRGIPKPWAKLLRSMTARDPEARPSAAEVTEAARLALRSTTRDPA